jgi:hypothetical protein
MYISMLLIKGFGSIIFSTITSPYNYADTIQLHKW